MGLAERFEELSAEAVAALCEIGNRRRVPAGSYLFIEGDESESVLFVLEGLIRIERTQSTGRRVLFSLAAPGSIIGDLGVLDEVVRSAAAAAIVDSEVFVVRAAPFRRCIAETPELAAELLRRVSARLRVLSDQMFEAATTSAETRLSARLVELIGMLGHDPTRPVCLEMPITQADLAEWAGLSREGAVGALRRMRDREILDTARRRIEVHRPDELLALAGLRP